jgi:hypothetical protein
MSCCSVKTVEDGSSTPISISCYSRRVSYEAFYDALCNKCFTYTLRPIRDHETLRESAAESLYTSWRDTTYRHLWMHLQRKGLSCGSWAAWMHAIPTGGFLVTGIKKHFLGDGGKQLVTDKLRRVWISLMSPDVGEASKCSYASNLKAPSSCTEYEDPLSK